MYRVDFSGTINDGTYDGYFTYETAWLDMNGSNINSTDGFELDLLVNYSYSGVSESFDETTASLYELIFSSGALTYWGVEGNILGSRSGRNYGGRRSGFFN